MTTLVAIVVNAHRNPTIEFEIAHEINGEWYTNAEVRVWPFATLEIEFDPEIPSGHIEYLFEQARIFALAKPSPKEDRASGTSLLASLGLPTKIHSAVSGTLKRRI